MSDSFELRILIGMLRRQFWLIVTVTAATLALASIAIFSITPRFTATGLILVDTASKDLLDSQRGVSNGLTDNSRVDSEVKIVQSDGVLLKVIKDQHLVSDDEFGIRLGLRDKILSALRIKEPALPSGEDAVGKVLEAFKNAVTSRRDGLTYLISVGVTSESATKAASLSNALMNAYIDQQVDSKVLETITSRNILQNRISNANRVLLEAEKEFDTFINSNIGRLQNESSSAPLVALRSQIEQVAKDKAERVRRLDRATESLSQGDLDSLVIELQSDAITELENQRSKLREQIASPSLTSNRQKFNLRQELLKVEQVLRARAPAELNQLRGSIESFDVKSDGLREQLRNAVSSSDLPPEDVTRLYALQQAIQIARSQYQNLMARSQELAAQASLQLADSKVVSAALAPYKASYPNKRIALALAGLIALGLSLMLAFLREYFIGGFTNEEQIAPVLGVPLASVVPQQNDRDWFGQKGLGLSDRVVSAPMSAFSEAIRRIRIAVDHALHMNPSTSELSASRTPGVVIMVTSSLPGEGKSTAALSLARNYAVTGRKTLLIDFDLRKPNIHRQIGEKSTPALVDFLRTEDASASLLGLIDKDPLSNLSIIVGGRRPNLPMSDLLVGPRVSQLISIAQQQF
jgi:succinoglycan biosynthesis transport protein ExoP